MARGFAFAQVSAGTARHFRGRRCEGASAATHGFDQSIGQAGRRARLSPFPDVDSTRDIFARKESFEIMILHDELRDLANAPEIFPLLRLHMQGAMAAVAAPGGRRHHYIEDASAFPMVAVAVHGSATEPVTLNFFATRGVYEEAAWELRPAGEAALRKEIVRRSADRAAQWTAARAEIARHDEEQRLYEQEMAPLRTEEAKAESLARLRAAFDLPARRRNWGRLSQDLYLVRDRIERPGDLRYVERIVVEYKKSWGFPFSEAQISWFDDILHRLVKSTRE